MIQDDAVHMRGLRGVACCSAQGVIIGWGACLALPLCMWWCDGVVVW